MWVKSHEAHSKWSYMISKQSVTEFQGRRHTRSQITQQKDKRFNVRKKCLAFEKYSQYAF